MTVEEAAKKRASDAEGPGDTFPRLLHRHYTQQGNNQVALRRKEYGIWREHTWEECHEKTKSISLGLVGLGLETADVVSILGYNSPEWFWCELAAQAAGGIVAGLDQARSIEEMKVLLTLAGTRFVFVQGQEQVDRLLEIKAELPSLRRIVYWNGKGLQHYDDPVLCSLGEMIDIGENLEKDRPGEFERRLAQGRQTDTAVLLFSRGANGDFKAVPATQGFLVSSARATLALKPIHSNDEYVSTISPSESFEQVLGFGVSLVSGQKLNFAEREETAPMDSREISPQVVVCPSNVWEMAAQVIRRNMESANRVNRALFNWGLSKGRERADLTNQGRRLGLRRIILNRLVELLVFRPLKDQHGLNRARVVYAVGGPLPEDTARLFQAIGVDIQEIFGSTKDGIASTLPLGNLN